MTGSQSWGCVPEKKVWLILKDVASFLKVRLSVKWRLGVANTPGLGYDSERLVS